MHKKNRLVENYRNPLDPSGGFDIHVPFEPGDVVWLLMEQIDGSFCVYPTHVTRIEIEQEKGYFRREIVVWHHNEYIKNELRYDFDEVGKSIFGTSREATAAWEKTREQ